MAVRMLFVVEVKNVVVLEIIPCDLVEQKQVVQVFPTMCQFPPSTRSSRWNQEGPSLGGVIPNAGGGFGPQQNVWGGFVPQPNGNAGELSW